MVFNSVLTTSTYPLTGNRAVQEVWDEGDSDEDEGYEYPQPAISVCLSYLPAYRTPTLLHKATSSLDSSRFPIRVVVGI